MKPSFHARPVNTVFEDPGLYVRVLRERRALMFDLGFTTNLSARDILKVSHIFISHMHVDHFIGFDNVLRICLKKEDPLTIFGPQGITDCIEGKLKGYTWNIIEDYPLVLHVSEIHPERVMRASFKAENSFRRENAGESPFQGILLEDPYFRVSSIILDHQVPCLAFSLDEDYHINIDKDKLNRMNLPVGPWLGELKAAIRQGRSDLVFSVNGKEYSFSEVRDVATITRGQKISYVVDALGSDENMAKIIRLAQGSDVLYIEAFFLDEDSGRAFQRYHLTARQAGRIAREARVGRMEAIHFSPRYIDGPDKLIREAEEAFNEGRRVQDIYL